MAQEEKNPEMLQSPADLRRTLAKRLAVAGGLVAVLLGVLAFFDRLSAPEESDEPVYLDPVPVPPKKELTQPVTPTEPSPEPATAEVLPEKTAEPPPEPQVTAQPIAPEPPPESKPEPMPAQRSATSPPVQPRTAPRPSAFLVPTAPTPKALPESAASFTSKPANEVVAPASLRLLPVPSRLFSGFVLQAGVFTSVQRAEELHAKLTLNGIPSTLETRVQVGPFKTREEAAAARKKMETLGIDPVLIPPSKGKR